MALKVNRQIEFLAKYLSENESVEYGLYGDNGGKVLFFLYYYIFTKEKKWKNLLNDEINQSFNYLANDAIDYTFCRGISGYLYLFNFLNREMGYDLDITEAESHYEMYLKNKMFEQIEYGHYDFLHSSLGLAYYFLYKMNVSYIERYIDTLLRISYKDSQGNLYWIDSLSPNVKHGSNIGLAHGMSSVVIFLSKVYSKNINRELVGRMLNSAVKHIFSQKILQVSVDIPNLYPTQSLLDSNLRSRLGWCYGDLSVAMALWQAGGALDSEIYRIEALNIFYNAKNRLNLKENFVFDASLCHGTAGIAHIFRRIYYETQDKLFLSLSNYWIDMTLKQGMHNDSLSGYKTLTDNGYSSSDCSLLEGLSGIALILLSSIIPSQYSNWDQLLLMH